jgi:hypothetical protein
LNVSSISWLLLYFYCHISVVLVVHWDIYKSSYSVSYLNSPLHHSPLSPSPHSWNSFNISHFSIFIHEYIIFHHIHPPPTSQTGLVLPSCSPFLKKIHFCYICCFKNWKMHTFLDWQPAHLIYRSMIEYIYGLWWISTLLLSSS